MKRNWLVYVGLSLAALGIIMLAFGQVFFHANQYVFNGVGDLFKAYFAFDYYLGHGKGSWHEGFHYPYGNHLVYLDVNPLLLIVIKGLMPIWDLSPYSHGILNLSMMLSPIPCACLIFSILRRTHLPTSYAFLMALVITFLSPQMMRMSGSFALALMFFVPLLWYFTLRLLDTKRWVRWLLVYGLTVTLFAAMHPYYSLLGAAWLTLVFGYQWVSHKQKKIKAKQYVFALLVAIMPAVSLKLWELFTFQGPTDFVNQPFGFLHYLAHPETVFLPFYAPFKEVWEFFIRVRTVDHEGYAYIGLPGTLITIALLLRVIKLIRARRWRRILVPVLPNTLQMALWPAVLLLFLAMGYPFKLVPGIVEYLGPIQQFRSLGRLAWFFYYVMMVFSAWWLYAILRLIRLQTRGKGLQSIWLAIMALAVFSWCLASASLVQSQRKGIFANNLETAFPERTPNYLTILQNAGYRVEQFQAILTFPHFHIGSEKFFTGNSQATRAGLAVSQGTGLPMINNMSARAPLTPSKRTLSLSAHPLIPKPLLEELPDRRPLLLVWVETDLSPNEKELVAKSEVLYQSDFLSIGKIELAAFNTSLREEVLAEFESIKDSLEVHDQLYSRDLYGVYFTSFDQFPGRLGGEVLDLPKRGEVIFEIDLLPLANLDHWELSFWMKIRSDNNYLPPGRVKLFREDQLIYNEKFEPSFTHDIYQNWARISISIPSQSEAAHMEVWMGGKGHVIDHLLLRPNSQDVYLNIPSENRLFLNNYPLGSAFP